MTKEVTGYKWNSEQAALNAQNSLKNHFLGGRANGNPKGDGKAYIATQWVSVEHNVGSEGDFFFFLGDFSPVLGSQPQTFLINVEDI